MIKRPEQESNNIHKDESRATFKKMYLGCDRN